VLVERYVDGRDYGAEGFMSDGKLHLLTVREMELTPPPHMQETGYRYPANLDPVGEDRVRTWLGRIADALGLHEVALHADFKIDGRGRLVLIELGARLPGYGLARDFVPKATGLDPHALAVDVALGRTPAADPTRRRATVMRFLPLPAGRVRRIELRSPPAGDAVVRCALVVGDTIAPITDGASAMKRGYVVATGASLEEAESRASEWLDGIVIEVDP
jgi:biotin carboxylase